MARVKIPIEICEQCDKIIANAVRVFESDVTPSHSTASRRYSVWSLLQRHLDAVLSDYFGQQLYSNCFGEAGFAKSAQANARKTEDAIRRMIRTLPNDHAAGALGQTLDTIVYLIYFCKSCRPTKSVGNHHLKGTAARTVTRKADHEHYPFCQLCWRLSQHAENHDENNPDCAENAGSMRFCAQHDPNNLKSQYRAAHNRRSLFHKKLREIYRGIKADRPLWENRLGDVSEQSVRRYAYELLTKKITDRKQQIMTLLASGLNQSETAKRLGIKRQAVSQAIKSIPAIYRLDESLNHQVC